MFDYITSLFNDPIATLTFFLLALPARLLALSMHEWAHAYVANRCGDPTARRMGRMSINPLRHLDVIGLIMMALLGFGWAKPVPVDPRNYKNPRRDDILVSLAGIVVNLILFVLSYLILCIVMLLALRSLPHYDNYMLAQADTFVSSYRGASVVISGDSYISIADLFRYAPYIAEDMLIVPVFGRIAGYACRMLCYFVTVNISLALFNLIPVPPLDGSHVAHSILLNHSPYASEKVRRVASGAMLLLMFSGVLGKGLSYACDGALRLMGRLLYLIAQAAGLV